MQSSEASDGHVPDPSVPPTNAGGGASSVAALHASIVATPSPETVFSNKVTALLLNEPSLQQHRISTSTGELSLAPEAIVLGNNIDVQNNNSLQNDPAAFNRQEDPLEIQSHNSPRPLDRRLFASSSKHRPTKSYDDVGKIDNDAAIDRFELLTRQYRRHSFCSMRGVLEEVREASRGSSLQTSLRPSLDNYDADPGTNEECGAATKPVVVKKT